MSHTRHGFTLLELLLTLGVVSIVLCIALPSWKNFSQHLRAKMITARLAESLRYARLEALLTHTDIKIKPIKNNYQFGWDILRGDTVIKHYPASPVSITSLQLSRKNMITFQENGMSEGSNGSFVINQEYKITLNRGGRINVSFISSHATAAARSSSHEQLGYEKQREN